MAKKRPFRELRVESDEVPEELQEVLDSTPTVTERKLEKAREGNAKPGRPRKAAKYADIIEATQDQMYLLLHFVPEALRELIVGVKVLEYDTNRGKEIVYRKSPDVNAIKLLLEKTLGKSVQQIEHSGSIEHTGEFKIESYLQDEELEDILEVSLNELRRKKQNVVDSTAEEVVTSDEEEPIEEEE